ncbi:MAG: nucleoside deaminase [Prolixibacteraceae bacterium]|nr:nucleoside deaminase [Prolixibacteraceae bacterium]
MQVFDDEYFMKKALEEAKEAYLEGEVPVGCVIVSGNKIIARSHNLTEKLNDVTAHAEMQAITSAANQLGGKYLTDCTIYVSVEPCVMCAGALSWAQIKKIVFGASDEKKGFLKYSSEILHPKTKVVKGIMEKECSLLMKNFFIERR